MCSRTTTLNPPLIDISSAVEFNNPRNISLPSKYLINREYREDIIISKLNYYINELNNIHLLLVGDQNFDYWVYRNNLLTIIEIKSQIDRILTSIPESISESDDIMKGIRDIMNRIHDFREIIQYNLDNSRNPLDD
jgi:hypothetical protein